MSVEGTLDTKIGDVLSLSPELTKGDSLIKGQIRLYDVDSDADTLESDAERFFNRTLLTGGLEDSLKRLRDTHQGEDNNRLHEMYGPYGTGKSHQMVALYHCFNSPGVVGDWADGHIDGLGEALPDDALPVVVSLQKEQYEHLWEPLFEQLDYESDEQQYGKEGGYPTIDVIQDAVGDRTVAFFMDELEDWFGSLSGRRKDANRGFLQALFETTSRPNTELFAFVSVLREGSDVHDILSREPERVQVNMSNQVDIRDVLHHRLVDSINDRSAMRALVDQYIEAYADTDYVDLPDGLREEMYDTYPFHPILINSLKTRYFAETESGATRGMLYLFAKVLVDQYQDTDLITHGAVDAVEYNDELTRINVEHSRPNRCYDDIRERLADADITYGRPILSTVLIYSLTPGLAEGATTSDIVIGTYHAGDRINDIIVDLERLQGEVYHLWRSDDRYVIREDENPRSLVKNAARDVDDEDAINLVGGTVETLFGSGAHAIGFNVDELENVPDSQNIKTVVKNGPWDADSVGEIIKNQPAGRQWRNTLVFVQPRNGKTISPTSQQEKFLGKAKEVIGAEIRKEDENLAGEIREEIEKLHDEYEDDLIERLESAYGEIIDGDDLLNEFDYAAEMSLENFVGTEPVLNASNIAAAAKADPFDLQRHVWEIARDRLDSRSETTMDDIYERFLMDPTYPIPGSAQEVVKAVEDGLKDKPILAHDSSGFKDELRGLNQDTVLVLENDVEKWSTDEAESELRGRFGAGTKEVDLGAFELDLRQRIDVWIYDQDLEDAVKMAAGRLANEDHYVLTSGSEILDKVRLDTSLRDISDAETIGSNEVRYRIEETIDATGEAGTSQVLTTIRNDAEVYLPPDSTESAFRSAVSTLLSEGCKLKTGGDYVSTFGDRDPTSVVIAPMVPDDIGERILNYIGDLNEEDTFKVERIQNACAAGQPEAAVKHFLLANLGKEEEPNYVGAATGAEAPGELFPDAGFRIPPETGWTFEYQGDSPAEMRQKWNESHESGSVSYGSLSFNTAGEGASPGGLQGVAEFQQAHTDLQLELGQSHEIVANILENIPESATSIDVTIQFE